MSDSPLASYVAISPNSNARTRAITKITPHHMAGNLTVEQCGAVFSASARQASSNYGIGTDGRIAVYVHENRRSWASSSAYNDQRAVTIEVANDEIGGSWHVSDAAWESLVALCADICKRNGIGHLERTGDKYGSLTEHRMFAATMCPGTYLDSRMDELADRVNAILEGREDMTPEQEQMLSAVYSEITDQSDPTGRDKPGTVGFKVKWMAAKQEAMQEDIDAIGEKVDAMGDLLEEIAAKLGVA